MCSSCPATATPRSDRGALIVLVHAGIADVRMWDGFELPGAVRHELRGFGQTPLPPAGSFSYADDLEAALDGRPAALVGASFGGQVCLEVAARRPALVPALVLLDAPLPDHDWSQEMLGFFGEEEDLLEEGELRAAARLNADFWTGPEAAPALRELIVEMQERAFELQQASEAQASEPGAIDLGAVRAKTLVVAGEHDKADFKRIAERLSREIPDARHEVVAGAGHLPALERPSQTLLLVRDFLGV